jgi:oligopeptidase A
MLTAGNDTLTSGIRGIEWDAVELPSQFMENFVYDEPTLYSFAKHWKTQEPLPKDMYKKLVAARTYRAGTQTLRQVHLATTDLFLHSKYDPAAHPEGI